MAKAPIYKLNVSLLQQQKYRAFSLQPVVALENLERAIVTNGFVEVMSNRTGMFRLQWVEERGFSEMVLDVQYPLKPP